ncbi:MAG: hypothetical protein HQL27_07360 [Candidatus Omnitrophica bacterium]|nr:hypothetical protein [Candidatus Omnitrophota bacterium]
MSNEIDKVFLGVQDIIGDFNPGDADLPALDRYELPVDEFVPFIKDIDESDNRYPEPLRSFEDQREDIIGLKLNDEERNAIEGGIRWVGIETLAFYKSRRDIAKKPFCGNWGIFYIHKGVNYLASEITSAYPGRGNAYKLALEFLRQHERFHYETDISALMMEAVKKEHLYDPLRYVLQKHRSSSVEEALANQRVLLWAQKKAGIEEYAYNFMKCQPNAYARFDEPLKELQSEYLYSLLDRSFGRTSRPPHPIAQWVLSVPDKLLVSTLCPEYYIQNVNYSNFIPAAFGFPPVLRVEDSPDVIEKLQGKYLHLKERWEKCKQKLVENCMAKALNFKPWIKKAKVWSVNVDGNFRAHLADIGNGLWRTIDLDNHAKMGHG